MHTVLCLIELAGLLAQEYVVGDFHGGQTKLLENFLAGGGVPVVEGGQTVQENGGGLSHSHHVLVHLIGQKQLDALLPKLGGLAHGDPDVGVQHVAVLRALLHVVGELDLRAGLGGDGLALLHQVGGGHQLLGPTGAEAHTQLGAHHHQGVGHVVAGIAEEGELATAHIAELLFDGEDVGQHLGGMEGVGQAVPHGHAGVTSQVLHHGLLEATVLNAVVHTAQHLGGVRQGLLLAHLRGGGVQEGAAHAQIAGAHLEGAAGTGRGLFKQQHHLLAGEPLVLHAVVLHALEFGG